MADLDDFKDDALAIKTPLNASISTSTRPFLIPLFLPLVAVLVVEGGIVPWRSAAWKKERPGDSEVHMHWNRSRMELEELDDDKN